MALRKDQSTGNYILTAAKDVEKHRARRKRYTKQSMQPRRLRFVDWISNLFSFRADPFIASPIAREIGQTQRLVSTCDRLSTEGSTVDQEHHIIESIKRRLNDYFMDARTDADDALDILDSDLDVEEGFLDECDPHKIRNDHVSKLREIVDNLGNRLGQIAADAAKAAVELSAFRNQHMLPNTINWGKRLTTGSVMLILGITIFEFILNTVLFAPTDPAGLIGAAGKVMLFSIVTIGFGILTGVCIQFCHQSSDGNGWIGRLGLGVIFFSVVYYLLLLTLVRLAAEHGDLDVYGTAAKMLALNPFSGLTDLPAFAYFIFSILVILLVGFEYTSIFGRFFGLRSRVLKADDLENLYDDTAIGIADESRSLTQGHLEALGTLPFFIQATVLPIKKIVADYDNVCEQLNNDIIHLTGAARIIYGYIVHRLSGGNINIDSLSDFASILDNEFRGKKPEAERLRDLKNRAEQLIDREAIQPESVERCRQQMGDNLKTHLEQLAKLSSDLKAARLRERQIAEADNPANRGRV